VYKEVFLIPLVGFHLVVSWVLFFFGLLFFSLNSMVGVLVFQIYFSSSLHRPLRDPHS
jgi:hypothetical protein